MDRKERKQAKLELKFKRKEEIAQAKENVKKSISQIREQIKLAKQKEITLKNQSKRDVVIEKEVLQDAVFADKAKFLRQKALIEENRKYLNAKKRELKEKVNLAKIQDRQIILEEKEKHRQAVLIAKRLKREEILKHKQNLEELKKEQMQRRIEAQKKLADKQDEIQAFKIKQMDLIAKKKIELIQQKQEMANERLEIKNKNQARRSKKLSDIQMEKAELKQLELEQRSKLAQLHLKRTSESLKEKSEINKEFIKEKEKSLKELDSLYQATRNAEAKQAEITKKEKGLDPETEEEKAKIWQQETEVKFNENEWDYSSDEKKELIKGVVVKTIGKDAWKIYDKANKTDTKLRLDKLKIDVTDKKLIKEFQTLKNDNKVTDIREFVKYVDYLVDRKGNNTLITNELVAVMVNILQGKTFQFLEGYLAVERHGKYRFLRYSDKLYAVASNVVSLPDEPLFNKLQEVILRKLKKGIVIKVNENLGLKYEDNNIVVLHDLGFLR